MLLARGTAHALPIVLAAIGIAFVAISLRWSGVLLPFALLCASVSIAYAGALVAYSAVLDRPRPSFVAVLVRALRRTPRVAATLPLVFFPGGFLLPAAILLREVPSRSDPVEAILSAIFGGAFAAGGLFIHARACLMLTVAAALDDAALGVDLSATSDRVVEGRLLVATLASAALYFGLVLPNTGALPIASSELRVAVALAGAVAGLLVHSALAVAVYALATRRSFSPEEP